MGNFLKSSAIVSFCKMTFFFPTAGHMGGGGCGDCSDGDDVFFLLGDYVDTLNSDARESPKRENATFRKRRKF